MPDNIMQLIAVEVPEFLLKFQSSSHFFYALDIIKILLKTKGLKKHCFNSFLKRT